MSDIVCTTVAGVTTYPNTPTRGPGKAMFDYVTLLSVVIFLCNRYSESVHTYIDQNKHMWLLGSQIMYTSWHLASDCWQSYHTCWARKRLKSWSEVLMELQRHEIMTLTLCASIVLCPPWWRLEATQRVPSPCTGPKWRTGSAQATTVSTGTRTP